MTWCCVLLMSCWMFMMFVPEVVDLPHVPSEPNRPSQANQSQEAATSAPIRTTEHMMLCVVGSGYLVSAHPHKPDRPSQARANWRQHPSRPRLHSVLWCCRYLQACVLWWCVGFASMRSSLARVSECTWRPSLGRNTPWLGVVLMLVSEVIKPWLSAATHIK